MITSKNQNIFKSDDHFCFYSFWLNVEVKRLSTPAMSFCVLRFKLFVNVLQHSWYQWRRSHQTCSKTSKCGRVEAGRAEYRTCQFRCSAAFQINTENKEQSVQNLQLLPQNNHLVLKRQNQSDPACRTERLTWQTNTGLHRKHCSAASSQQDWRGFF